MWLCCDVPGREHTRGAHRAPLAQEQTGLGEHLPFLQLGSPLLGWLPSISLQSQAVFCNGSWFLWPSPGRAGWQSHPHPARCPLSVAARAEVSELELSWAGKTQTFKGETEREGGKSDEHTCFKRTHCLFSPLPFLFSESSCAFFQHF